MGRGVPTGKCRSRGDRDTEWARDLRENLRQFVNRRPTTTVLMVKTLVIAACLVNLSGKSRRIRASHADRWRQWRHRSSRKRSVSHRFHYRDLRVRRYFVGR